MACHHPSAPRINDVELSTEYTVMPGTLNLILSCCFSSVLRASWLIASSGSHLQYESEVFSSGMDKPYVTKARDTRQCTQLLESYSPSSS